MRRLSLLAVGLLAPPLLAAPTGVFVQLGLTDREPTQWRGQVTLDQGALTAMEGWLFDKEDGLDGGGRFHLTTDPLPTRNRPTQPNGLLLQLDAPETATLTLTANGRSVSTTLRELPWGTTLKGLDGAASLTRTAAYTTLQDTAGREDDWPAATTLPGGETVAVWQSWTEAEGLDRLYLARLREGVWQPAETVPGVVGDLFLPQVTGDGAGGLWVVWSEMIDGDFELRASRQVGGRWQAPVRLTTRPGHDSWPAVATAADGTVHVVWRGYNGPSADIFAATCVGGVWSAPRVIDNSPGNEWAPAVAAGSSGVWATWDSYRHGSYDVFAKRLDADEPILPIAASPRFEAWPQVAVAPDGGVWFVWQEAGENWGKDTGRTVPRELQRERIYSQRRIAGAVLREGRWQRLPDPAAAAETSQNFMEAPRLTVDRSGRPWLVYRQPLNVPRQMGTKTFGEKVYETFATYLTPTGWVKARHLAGRMARLDSWPVVTPSGAGVAVVFHTDGRERPDLRRPTRQRIFGLTLTTADPTGLPALEPWPTPTPTPVNQPEEEAIRRCREHVVNVGERALRLVRGDTHRHTDVSWDGTGDGGLIDSYRYAQDAARLDFYLVSDHNQRCGVDLPYVRWWNYKIADVMHNPGVFTTFFGYERSLGYPNGHRNVLQVQRGLPSFPMGQTAPDLPKLYDYSRQTGSIVFPHTTGTNHGTDWYAYDRSQEPVMEIFQGCRLCYEYEGAPKSGTPGDDQARDTGYQPRGFLWRAWQQDFRLGIISSSDHGSTHYSYAMAYTPTIDRDAIRDAILARHTYGANDNILIDYTVGERFMGDEFPSATPPTLTIRIRGTDELKQVDIIKDYQFVYTTNPEGRDFDLQWRDNQVTPGTHLYYVRVQQEDTSIAWASPVWIDQK